MQAAMKGPGPTFLHTLSLFELNWLPALYAHTVWWGALAAHRPAQALSQALAQAPAQASAPRNGLLRLLHRASAPLLEAQGLWARSANTVAPHAWVLWPQEDVHALAQRVGRVSLADRVRQSLQRAQVLRTIDLLGPGGRDQALVDAQCWPALATRAAQGAALPRDVAGVGLLGAQVLAGLLESPTTGLQERFTLRFAPAAFTPAELTPEQRGEALALVAAYSEQIQAQVQAQAQAQAHTQSHPQAQESA